jgi:hypothetical protein
MPSETWKEILNFLPPLAILLILVLSPAAMGFIQKKIFLFEERKKRKKAEQSPPQEDSSEKTEIPLSGRPRKSRRFAEWSDTNMEVSGSERMPANGKSPTEKIRELSPLQQAVVWAEILGPPGGKSS